MIGNTFQVILLSGGLSTNNYVQEMLKNEFESRGIDVELPAVEYR